MARWQRAAQSVLDNRLPWLWIGVWVATRALMVAQVGYVILTAGLYQAPANMLIRNTALLVLAADAALGMVVLLQGGKGRANRERGVAGVSLPPQALGQS